MAHRRVAAGLKRKSVDIGEKRVKVQKIDARNMQDAT
jgi:hypothetical protein